MRSAHSIRMVGCVLAVCMAGGGSAPNGQAPQAASAPSFTIFVDGVAIGSERVAVERTEEGWSISGSGRVGAPVDLLIRRLQIRYDAQWRPLGALLDYTQGGRTTLMTTMVSGTDARDEIVVDGQAVQRTSAIDPDAVLLPNSFFAPYEALAARLRTAGEGTSLAGYIAPNGQLTVTVGRSSTERVQTYVRVIEVRRTQVTLQGASGPALAVEIWGDEEGRLMRVRIPAQAVDVVREDLASVSTRRVLVSREADEAVRLPANGFTLAGTVSKPADSSVPLPAVVLVGGSVTTDRDEVAHGIPIFGYLSDDLAGSGYLVLRYDKRGVGQSGGRAEAATLDDYADDLRRAVRYMSERKDVDRRRLAVVGYGEGSAVAMMAARRENRVRALGLIAGIGITGAELNMAQVLHGLNRSTRSDAERTEVIELQQRIQEAVLTGQGWDEIPEAYRDQADIPWFKSFLAFDPATLMNNIRQPLLIVQPMLDTQVDPSNADRLAEMARARRRQASVELVRLEGLNHLLVPASTGEFEEYATLAEERISPAVAQAIVRWLPGAFEAAP